MNDRNALFKRFELNHANLNEQIANNIQAIIAKNHLEPGSRLPSERELAKLLGVNRATVREAVLLLQQRGLVKIELGSGTFVTDMPRSVVSESIERYFTFGSCSHEDLVTLREILEPETAALAAKKAIQEDIAALEELVRRIEDTFSKNDASEYAAADASFHEALAVATHNELIVAIAFGLQNVMRTWMQAQNQSYRSEEGARSHRAIYEAVAAHNPERATSAMRVHMGTTRATLERNGDVAKP